MLALGACLLAVCWMLFAPACAAAVDLPVAELRAGSDVELASRVARLEQEAARTGEELLLEDARRDDILRERDVARDLLGAFMAAAYKQGSVGDGLVTQLFSSASIGEAADRVRVAGAVGRHHGSLIRTLDSAEARLDVGQLERARMIARLGAVQAQLVQIRDEQSRRAVIRAERAATRRDATNAAAAKRAREAAAVAVTAPGTLVAGSSFLASGMPASAASIDAYLASKGSPMVGQGAAFHASGQRWRVDPRLLVAIAGAESNFGAITCGPHNAWGWACPNDPADFATWAAGIDTVTKGLRRYYLDEGRTSVALIQQKYCPVGAANDPTGLNSAWLGNVTDFLVEQGGNPAVVGPGPDSGGIQLPDLGGLGFAMPSS